MGAKAMLAVMVVGTIGTILGVPTRSTARRADVHVRRHLHAPGAEQPWLGREAAAALVGSDGRPGELFDDVELGGPAPLPSVQDRLERFARANHVEIAIDTRGAKVAAIRIAVSFPGCCGYEGADVFALRLDREKIGCPWRRWADAWAWDRDGVHMQARVALNRVDVRWEPGAPPKRDATAYESAR